MEWRFGEHGFEWGASSRTLVMGVLNVTPDSFSDGGRFVDPGAAARQAQGLIAQGADLIDIGGESSRPGRTPVSAAEERARVLPVIERVRAASPVPISIDTTKVSVAEAALEAGADVVNDIGGLVDPAMAALVARAGAGAIVMHMRGQPETMQAGDLSAQDLVGDVVDWFRTRLEALDAVGIPRAALCLDPGIGFGKTVTQNVRLIAQLARLRALGRPVLVGASRKSFLGALTERPVDAREAGTAAANACAVLLGAQVLRVHDAAAAQDAARVAEAIRGAGSVGL